ncbi:hypothetical protein BN1058_00610 [Paraliobacillus sp. PM-2]|uniref:hypothetical protein n=1 Tax=Paraliobacillus sp. PM-2 TaxID=1462524 RepID=UPI00061C4DEC|nr:hypothetical protein [Paraliobacillus sp. PM-2]CQR46354.1 hypothetical protein BN1058_00610 [Paraliobacillus sp. PM-2]
MSYLKKLTGIVFTFAILAYAFLHYTTYISPTEKGFYYLGIVGITVLVTGMTRLSFRALIVPTFLLFAAFLIQWLTGGGFVNLLIQGVSKMSNLITLLLIVPVISWILREESYIDAIIRLGQRLFHSSKKFYVGIMLVNQIIAYFLLFGSIPMMYEFINDFFRSKTGEAWEYFKGTALLRSFALTTLWVVSIPSFAFAVDHLGASLGWTILQGFVISMLGIGLALVFLTRKEKAYQINFTIGIKEEMQHRLNSAMPQKEAKKLVVEFSILFVSLFSTIFVIHFLLGWSILAIIPPIIVIWTAGYFIFKKRPERFVAECKAYIAVDIKQKAQQFSLLLAAGMLIYAINQSGVSEYMVDALFYLADVIPFMNFLAIIPFMAIILGFLGLGPLTVIVLVAGILENVSLIYPSELVVLAMTSGSVISVMLSPVVLPVIILSTTNRLSIIKNGLGFNWSYAFLFYLMVQLYIQTVWYIIG